MSLPLILPESGLPESVCRPTRKGLQARSSVRSPGHDAKCGRPTCLKGKLEAGIQCHTCSKWFHFACGGVGKDI